MAFYSQLPLLLTRLAIKAPGLRAFGEASRLTLSFHDLEAPGLPASFYGLKIAQLTDVHLHDEYLPPATAQAFLYLKAHQPDILLHTGDFWDTPEGHAASPKHLLALRGRLATAVVPGNWEYSSVSPSLVRSTYEEAGVTWLANQSTLVPTSSHTGAALCLAGLDSYRQGAPDPAALFPRLAYPSVLIVHEPGPVADFPPLPALITTLAGHTHGGQVRLPFLPPPIMPSLSLPFIAGWYYPAASPLYVCRGIGGHGPFRFGAPPELAIFTIVPGPLAKPRRQR